MRVRIATCRPLPEPDPDEAPLLEAFAAAGVETHMAVWSDPREPWDAAVPTIVRSTWDYIHDVAAFRAWIERAERAAPLWNPARVMLGNLHKRYLVELGARRVATVPTWLAARGSSERLSVAVAAFGWSDVVVKPAVGAGSFETHRFRSVRSGEGDAAFAALVAERDMLVQPYLPSVEEYGERALVWIDGEFTHAVRKTPRFTGGVEQVSEALPIAPEERELGTAALAPIAKHLLYARVDVARGDDGRPRVMELELVEPSLFLVQEPRALARLVAGVLARLSTSTR